MKKLMIVACAVAVAAVAQAGSVNWGISSVAGIPGGGQDWLTGGAAYLFEAATFDAAAAEAAIKGGTFSTYAANAVYSVTSDAFSDGSLTQKGILAGQYDGVQTYFNAVIVDDASNIGYYMITDSASVKPPTTAAAKPLSYDMYGVEWSSAGADTPEPTSGLLLLLGVAGLALRRRRA